jgi:Methyltransferase domain
MLKWGQTKRLSRMVAVRDAWLLQREARIQSLETTISDLEGALRQREAAIRERESEAQTEIVRREATIRDREERIAWLEGRIRRLETPSLPPRTDNLPVRLTEMLARLPGWCPEEKASWMVEQITANRYQTAAELGVFAGRSVFPVALAIAANQGRAVYAVDAWENAVATADPGDARDHRWWDSVDLVAIKSAFLGEVIAQNMVGLIKILELTSAEACAALSGQLGRGIDFLHIDGAHSEAQALHDVANWSPLVTAGGTIVLDDIDWPGVRGADAFLEERFERIAERRGDGFAFAAFRVA